MLFKTMPRLRERNVLLALAAIMVPLAIGCAGDDPSVTVEVDPSANGGGGANNVPGLGIPLPNARAAFMLREATTATAKLTGTANAMIDNTATSIDYTPATTSIGALKGMTGSDQTFKNSEAVANVVLTPDVDGNGKADTFLMLTSRNLPANAGTEVSAAYKGPFTSAAQVQSLQAGSMTATYKGGAGLAGTIAGVTVTQTGKLDMSVDFGKSTLSGKIALDPLAAGSADPGHAYDNITFGGKLTAGTSDYSIESATINNGTKAITDDKAAGIGSFMGANAKGTIGTFVKSSTITGTTDQANVVGYFHGSQ